jgi:hypothetical protein
MAGIVLGLTAVLAIAAMFWMGRRLHQAVPEVAAIPAAVVPASELISVEPAPNHSARSRAASMLTRAAEPVPSMAAPGFALSGIVEGLGQPCAMINTAIVCLGERVAGSTLVEVGDRAVTLEQADGTQLTLRLPR